MDQKYKWLLAGISLTALTVAGCGTMPASNQGSPNVTSTNSSGNSSLNSASNSTMNSSSGTAAVDNNAIANNTTSNTPTGTSSFAASSTSVQSVTKSFGGAKATIDVPKGWQEKSVSVGDSGGFEWTNPKNPKQQLVLISTGNVGSMQNSTGQWDVKGLFGSPDVHWTWVADNSLSGNFTSSWEKNPYDSQSINTGYEAYGKATIAEKPSPLGVYVEVWGPKSLANQVVPSLLVSSGNGASASSTALTLENLQFSATGLTVLTTHGNMNDTLVNPHFTSTNPKEFVFTLRNVLPGKYSLNQPLSIQSNWATSMTIQQQGTNLIFTCQLKPSISKFTNGIGGGDMLQFIFS